MVIVEKDFTYHYLYRVSHPKETIKQSRFFVYLTDKEVSEFLQINEPPISEQIKKLISDYISELNKTEEDKE